MSIRYIALGVGLGLVLAGLLIGVVVLPVVPAVAVAIISALVTGLVQKSTRLLDPALPGLHRATQITFNGLAILAVLLIVSLGMNPSIPAVVAWVVVLLVIFAGLGDFTLVGWLRNLFPNLEIPDPEVRER